MKPRHWWHCTEVNHGPSFTSKLLTPPNKGHIEPTTPRLCVGPSVAACFAARFFWHHTYCYRTAQPCRAVKPKGTWDAIITGERWIVHPVRLELVTTVPVEKVREIMASTREYLLSRRKGVTPRMSILLYLRAIQRLKKLGPQYSHRWELEMMADFILTLRQRVEVDPEAEVTNRELIEIVNQLRTEGHHVSM